MFKIRPHSIRTPGIMKGTPVYQRPPKGKVGWNDGRGASDRKQHPGAIIKASGVEVLTKDGWCNNYGKGYRVSHNNVVRNLGKVRPSADPRFWILNGVSMRAGVKNADSWRKIG